MDNYAIQIERAVINAILFNPESYENIAAQLKPTDFSHIPHQKIYETFEVLNREEQPLSEEFLRKKLAYEKGFDEQDLLDILATNPMVHVESYIGEIKDSAMKRALHTLANHIREYSLESDMVATDIADRVQAELYKIMQESESREFRGSEEITHDTLDHIKKMKEKANSGLIGVDTGFFELNKKTTGFGKGDLIILAARPAMGKTALVLNMVLKSLENGDGVAVFSLEMPAEQLMLRLLSAKTSIHLQNLRIGNLLDEEWSRLSGACDDMSKKKLFVDDNGSLNIHQLRAKLRKLKTKHPEVKMCVIDYLQLMTGSGGKDRHLEVSEISRNLKLLARELELPIIALSQLNRGLESRPDKRPMLSDLRESGAIEQDADIILFVYRDSVYKKKEEDDKEKEAQQKGDRYVRQYVEKEEEEAEVIIGKQRNGPIGTIKLIFQKNYTRFVDADRTGEVEIVFTQAKIDTSSEAKVDIPTI